MKVNIDSPEETNLVYTGYTGKVLSVETHITTAVHPGQVGLTASTFETRKAKAALANGRIKEFDADKIEMQAGDDVEFITASDDKSIYIKNLTTGVSNVADLRYTPWEGTSILGIACIAVVVYGVYSIFWGKSFMTGLSCVVGGSIALTIIIKARSFLKGISESNFHEKVRATGIKVTKFKPVQEVDSIGVR